MAIKQTKQGGGYGPGPSTMGTQPDTQPPRISSNIGVPGKGVGRGPITQAKSMGGVSPAKSPNAKTGTKMSGAGGMSSDSPYKGVGQKKGSGRALAAAVKKANATRTGANKNSRLGRMGSK